MLRAVNRCSKNTVVGTADVMYVVEVLRWFATLKETTCLAPDRLLKALDGGLDFTPVAKSTKTRTIDP